MKRYTVVWEDLASASNATNDLARIWLKAKDNDAKDAINRAASLIDKELAVDASSKGAPLSEGMRALNIAPLRVIFSVNEEASEVVIGAVRAI